MSKSISTDRLQTILTREAEPETSSEKYLLISYERGKLGDTLLNCIENFPVEYEKLNETQKDMFLIGYALGQKYHIEVEMKKQFNNNDNH